MDKSLGDLMDYLKALGVANRTLVVSCPTTAETLHPAEL